MSAEADRVWIHVNDAGAVGTVRRAAAAVAAEIGLSAERIAGLALVSSELASNLYKHATDGVLLVRLVRRGGQAGVQLVAVDNGPGMADLNVSAIDGHSTAGTLGIGLGSVFRQAGEVEGFSLPHRGTVIAATVWPEQTPAHGRLDRLVAGLSRPMAGEVVTGDGYAARERDDRTQIMLCDGLGHGPLAAIAGQAAVEAFHHAPSGGPKLVVEHIHQSVTHTRGVVVTVVEFDRDRDKLRFAGLGNVAGSVNDGSSKRMLLAQPGIAGHRRATVRELELPCPAGALVVLHSDGLTDRWQLTDYPGLIRQPPLVVAATLLRDAGVRRDDAAVLVARTGA